jgi:hypothetical protein
MVVPLLFVILCFLCVNTTFADELIFDYNAYSLNADFGIYPHHEHKSTKTTSPLLLVNEWQKDRMSKTGSHIFLRNDANGDSGPELDTSPLILSADDLSAVYIDRRYQSVFDVRVQKNNGADFLTFFGGPISGIGLGNGYSYVFDTSYRQVHRVAAQKLSVKADLHEFELTGHGTALLTAYDTVARPYQRRDELDVRAVGHGPGTGKGGRRSLLRDSVFQEIELDTNELLFQWRASEHIPMADSFEDLKSPWDFFHLNSIQKVCLF